MAWSYDVADLTTTTSSVRINTVRLLVGDTDTTDQLVQNEEVAFALAQVNNNVYYAGSWVCKAIAAKFSRMVTTTLDGALSSNYSDRAKQYQQLSIQIEAQGRKTSGKSLGVFGGGISVVAVEAVRENPDRIKPAFTIDQFENTGAVDQYITDEPNGI
jgi:hypothetical protein